jgi:hypothetical protein
VKILTLLIFAGCASSPWDQGELKQPRSATTFAYQDVSGEFEQNREILFEKNRLATRTQLMSSTNSGERMLEKTFALSGYGSVKTKKGRVAAMRPMLSQHTVWLEGKKYFSQLKLDPAKKSMNVIMQSPESKWNGSKSIKVPRGTVFCFYSQLPECLAISGLLSEVKTKRQPRANFHLVWDSYPYHQEHFTGLPAGAFSAARLTLEKSEANRTRFDVEVEGQTLSLHFSKSGEFARMFWTTQGISLLPPGEAAKNPQL